MSLSHLDKVLTGIGPWFLSTLKTLVNSILDIVKKYIFDFYGLMVTLILLAILLVLMEIQDRAVMLEPILVSQKIVDMGYTPDIVARRLKDSANEYHTDEVINIKETILSYRYHELDIELPEVGISIKSVSNYFRHHFKRNITIISGEMLYHEAKNQISFRLRLNSEQIFDDSKSFSEEGIITLINEAGYVLTKRVNPFALAVYHYKDDKEPENAQAIAQEIANYIITNLDKDEYDYAQAVNLKGILHHNDGEYEEAIKYYKWAIDLDSSFVAPYTNWAGVLAKKGDYHEALKKIEEANKIEPDNVAIYVYWCRLLVSKKIPDWKGAINKCTKALKLNPDNASAHLYWGIALMNKSDWDGAIEKFRETLKLDPGNISAHINLGVALRDKSEPDLEGAIEKYKETLKLEPGNALAYIHWGIGLMNKSDWDGAIKKYEKSLKLDPGNALAHFYWGIALMNKSDWDGAIDKYKKVIELQPMNYGAYNYIVISLFNVNKSNIAGKVQGCMNFLIDRYKRLECSELVLSINTWGIHRIIGLFAK